MTPALMLMLLSADPARPKLGVSDFAAPKEAQAIAAAANSLVANELQRLGAFEVTTADQTRQLLGYERQQQLLGCSSDACSSNLGAVLNMDYLVTGQLTQLRGAGGAPSFNLDLQLMSVKTGKRERGETITGATEQNLIVNVTPAVVKLVQAILKEQSGSLVLTSSEVGSTVKVDDSVVGVTPLEGRLTLAGGPHIVAVEKDGYVTWHKEVRVVTGGLVEERVHLVPSPDTIAAWESKQTKLRIGAISCTALAVIGAAAGIAFQAFAAREFGDASTINDPMGSSFVWYRARLNDGIEVGPNGENYRTLAGSSKATISTYQTISWVGIGVGAASAAGAAALWVLSDDPGKYRAYREVKLALMPLQNGGFASLSGSF